jgi:hypothetical protein
MQKDKEPKQNNEEASEHFIHIEDGTFLDEKILHIKDNPGAEEGDSQKEEE